MISFEVINTRRNDSDFRGVIITIEECGKYYVIKLADNDFTFPEKIEMWRRTAEEYRKLDYYCPGIFYDKSVNFPTAPYKGRNRVAYAEEYSPYYSADYFKPVKDEIGSYKRQKWIITAKIA